MGERKRSAIPARWWLAASALAIVICAGVPLFEVWLVPELDTGLVPGQPRFDARTRNAVESVLSPRENGPEPTLEGLVENLLALKPRAIPVLVAVACGELTLPEVVPGTREGRVHPRAIELRSAAVAESLRRFPPATVATHLHAESVGAPPDVALICVRLLGDCDDASALDTLLEITRSLEPIQLRRTYVTGLLETALVKHFVRHPAALDQLELLGQDDAWPVFVHAASASRTTTSARWLAQLLGRNRDLDLAVVEELGRSAEGGRFALPEEVVERLRDALPRADDQMRRLAAIALGNAREGEAFDDLVQLLGATDPLIVIAARHGLTAITGTDLGPDSGEWLDWRVAQDGWYAENSVRLLEQLAEPDPARANEAMGAMLARGFFRHEWAYEIGARLAAAEGPLFATACASLAALGSSRAVPWLVDALDREDERERELARDALHALTGLDLPAERAAWNEALEL